MNTEWMTKTKGNPLTKTLLDRTTFYMQCP
jgi:hypothetical protein